MLFVLLHNQRTWRTKPNFITTSSKT